MSQRTSQSESSQAQPLNMSKFVSVQHRPETTEEDGKEATQAAQVTT